MHHLTGLLWRLGAAQPALRALDAVYRDSTAALRPYVVNAPPRTRSGEPQESCSGADSATGESATVQWRPCVRPGPACPGTTESTE